MIEPIVLVASTVALIAAVAVGPRPLRLRRDFFFLFLLAQVWTYTLFAPAARLLLEQRVADPYVAVQLPVFLLFALPLAIGYRILVVRMNVVDRSIRLSLSERRAVVAIIGILLFEIAYIFVAARTNMFVRRIGTYQLAESVANLDPLSLLILRSHDLISLPLLAYLIVILRRARLYGGVQVGIWMCIAALAATVVTFGVLNSRLSLVLDAVVLFGAVLLTAYRPTGAGLAKTAIVLTLAAAYFTSLTENVRTLQVTHDPAIRALDPLYWYEESAARFAVLPSPSASAASPVTPAPTSLTTSTPTSLMPHTVPINEAAGTVFRYGSVDRVDCVDLIVLMSPALDQRGFALGRAWGVPIFIATTQMFAPGLSTEFKRQARTTAKSYLIEQYTMLDPGDYYSCALTDTFGNFGFAGLMPLAGLLAIAFAGAAKLLWSPPTVVRRHGVVLALIAVTYLLPFEQEGVSYLVGWIKYLPVVIAAILLNPVTAVGPDVGANISESSTTR